MSKSECPKNLSSLFHAPKNLSSLFRPMPLQFHRPTNQFESLNSETDGICKEQQREPMCLKSPEKTESRSLSQGVSLKEIAIQVCRTIRTMPMWEKSLTSKFRDVHVAFDSKLVVTEVLKLENNAALSYKFFKWACKQEVVVPETGIWNQVFDSLVKAKEWKDAYEMLTIEKNFEHEFGRAPLDESKLECVIIGLCRADMVQEAMDLFEMFRKQFGSVPRLDVWNSLLLGFVRIQRTDLVWEIYGQLLSSSITMNIDTVSCLIEASCLERKPIEGFDLLYEVISTDLGIPYMVTLNKLVDGLCRRKAFSTVSRLLHIMIVKNRMPNLVTYEQIIHWLFKHGRENDAIRVFRDLGLRGYDPRVSSYSIVIDGLCKIGRVGDAKELWDEMVYKRLVPTEHAYNAMIDGHCKLGAMGAAEELFKDMRRKCDNVDVVTYNTMISGYCQQGDIDEASRFFEEMKRRGVSCNATTYSIFIKAFCELGNVDEAMKFYDKLLEDGLNPLDSSCVPLIQFLCREGKMSQALEMFDGMLARGVKPISCIHDHIINSYCRIGDVVQGMGLLIGMLREKSRPREHTFLKMIDCLCLQEQLDDALLIVEAMLSAGYQLCPSLCVSITSKLLQGGSSKDSIKNCFAEVFIEDVKTIDCVL